MNWSSMFSYDPATGNLIWLPRVNNAGGFNVRFAGKPAGTLSATGYINVRIGRREHKAHRIIWEMLVGPIQDEIDHIDRNRANNRLENLRPATRSENNMNRPVFKRHKVGSKGITYDAKKKLYRARVQVGGKRIGLGRYKSLADAEAAYVKGVAQYHKDFANAG